MKDVPLGWLFGVTGSLNDHMGAAAGHRDKTCKTNHKSRVLHGVSLKVIISCIIVKPSLYHDYCRSFALLKLNDVTGYFYFPMPYWSSARVSVRSASDEAQFACFQVTRIDNHYNRSHTAHLHAQASFYADDVSGWRRILQVENSWGHVVNI